MSFFEKAEENNKIPDEFKLNEDHITKKITQDIKKEAYRKQINNVIENPLFLGAMNDKQNFKIQAEKGIKEENIVNLYDIKSVIEESGEVIFQVLISQARFNIDEKILFIHNNHNLLLNSSAKEMKLKVSEDMTIDYKNFIAYPISIKSNLFELFADKASFADKNKSILFEGNVRVRYHQVDAFKN